MATVWVSTSEAAQLLGLTPQAVRARVKAGTLVPAEQVGRAYIFERAEIEALLDTEVVA